jgi:hypothetical protein
MTKKAVASKAPILKIKHGNERFFEGLILQLNQ